MYIREEQKRIERRRREKERNKKRNEGNYRLRISLGQVFAKSSGFLSRKAAYPPFKGRKDRARDGTKVSDDELQIRTKSTESTYPRN